MLFCYRTWQHGDGSSNTATGEGSYRCCARWTLTAPKRLTYWLNYKESYHRLLACSKEFFFMVTVFRCTYEEWIELKNKRPTWCHLLFYFTSYVLNMFRTLIFPTSGACDYSVELPHWSYCSWFDVCWSFGVVGLEWYPCYHTNPTTPKLQHT